MAISQQELFGAGASLRESRLEMLGDSGAQFAVTAGMALGQYFEIGGERRRLDQFTRAARRSLNVQHHG
jgi:hypothetical protein